MTDIALDRRSFLRTSLAAGAGVGLVTTASPRILRAQSGGVNVNLYAALQNMQLLAGGNSFQGHPAASDYSALSNCYANVLNDWNANGGDRILATAIAQMSTDTLRNFTPNLDQVTPAFQQFNPGITSAQLLGYHDGARSKCEDDDYLTVLNNLRSTGLAPYLAQAGQNAATIASHLASSNNNVTGGLDPDFRVAPTPGDDRGYHYLAKKVVSGFFLAFGAVGFANSFASALFGETIFAAASPWLFVAVGAASIGWGFYNWIND